MSSYPKLFKAIQENDVATIEQLIKEGADPCLSYSEEFPLFIATAYNHADLIEFLVKSGANINQATDLIKWTSLINAAYWGHCRSTKTLLKKGANPFLKSVHGYTALDLAKIHRQEEVEKILKSYLLYK